MSTKVHVREHFEGAFTMKPGQPEIGRVCLLPDQASEFKTLTGIEAAAT